MQNLWNVYVNFSKSQWVGIVSVFDIVRVKSLPIYQQFIVAIILLHS